VKHDEETELISTLRIHFMHYVRTEHKKLVKISYCSY